MLSAETAAGNYPVDVVLAMDRICIEAEKSHPMRLDTGLLDRGFSRIDQSIAVSALFAAHHMKARALVALTQSGSTALWMSRFNSGVPIFALTPEDKTRRRVSLYRDVTPVLMPGGVAEDRDMLMAEAEALLIERGIASPGDVIVVTCGEPLGKSGGTNTMKIMKVGADR
jgi:pyruvate kinase